MNNEFKRMQQLAGLREDDNDNESEISLERAKLYIVLTPSNATLEETEKAFEDIENYGVFKTQAIRNGSTNKGEIEKAIEDHFGPSVPSKKKAALKLRGGEPFPIRTKQSIDDFIKQFSGKPRLLFWEKEGDSLAFKQGKNPPKKILKDIINTVMDNAGIEYKLSEKEEI